MPMDDSLYRMVGRNLKPKGTMTMPETIVRLGRRPLDWYGFDDYAGGDVNTEIAAHEAQQAEWDRDYAKLSWWQRLVFFWKGSVGC